MTHKSETENRAAAKDLRRLICLCGVLAVFLAAALCRAQTAIPPAPLAPRPLQIPNVTEKTLANGLRVIVAPRRNVPLTTAQFLIKSGGEIDPRDAAGAADMTAELLIKGTKIRSATKLAQQIEFLGGELESGAQWDRAGITFQVTSDKFEKALAIAADAIRNPVFAPAEIKRHKMQILDELKVNLTQPDTVAGWVANQIVFGGSSYAHLLSGTPESLKNINRAVLLQIHRTYYAPNNSILIVAGDVTPAQVFAEAQKHFGNWARKPLRKTIVTPLDAAPGAASDSLKVSAAIVIDLPAAGQAAVVVAKSNSARSDPNHFYRQIADSVLGGGYSSRLNQEIRIKRGLSYGANSFYNARRSGGIWYAQAQTKNESAAAVAEVMLNELNGLANNSIGETELAARKAAVIGEFAREFETTGGLVEQIAEFAVYDLPLEQMNLYVQNVQAVGDWEIRRSVKQNFMESAAHVVIVGDAKKFLPELRQKFQNLQIKVVPAVQLDLNENNWRKPTRFSSK